MTTYTSPPKHRQTTHHVHLPRSAPRRTSAAVLVVLGAVLIAMTFANNLFKVGPSFEDLMGGFRPHLTNSAMATAQTDVQGLGAAGTEMSNVMLPALAQRLGMSQAEFSAYFAKTYPDVAAGVQALPQISTTFSGLITTLDQQRPLFRSADAIPTKDIPATSVSWTLAAAGALLVGTGALLWVRPRPAAAVAVVLGTVMVVVPIMLSLPQKASDSDDLNSNLKPVYTTTMVQQAQGALTTVSAMSTQLQTSLLPDLATRLQMTPAQLQQMLVTSFPATAAALANLPQAMPRFQSLVSDFNAHLGDYDTLKPVSFTPIIWTLMGVGALTLLVGGATLLWPRHAVVSLRV
jgi:hypothetical protein